MKSEWRIGLKSGHLSRQMEVIATGLREIADTLARTSQALAEIPEKYCDTCGRELEFDAKRSDERKTVKQCRCGEMYIFPPDEQE